MNNENAHKYLPFVQALVEGKKLQYKVTDSINIWTDIEDVRFVYPPEDYRIKPKPVIIRTRRALLHQGNDTWVSILHDLPDYVKPEEFMHNNKDIFVCWIDNDWVEHQLFLE